jgi:tRNA A-37 threonylcarbamoyl transferase component Bud32
LATKIVHRASAGWSGDTENRLILFLDRYLRDDPGLPSALQSSASSACFRLPFPVPDRDAFIKIYSYKGLRRLLRGFLRNTFFGSSRARREWTNLLRLSGLGVRVPEPLALLERRRFRALEACALVTRWVPDAGTADEFLGRAKVDDRRLLVREVAHLTATMHNARYADGDLHLRNLLVRRDDATASASHLEVFKFDSPAGRVTCSARRQCHDLACLEVGARRFLSRTERLRFWRTYRQHRNPDARLHESEREWLRAVRARADLLEPKEGRRVDAVRSRS